MEREILVANTRTQQRHKFTADVTTLAELKAVLDEKGIDYSGMSFTEGISNVQLNDDSSQLPHDALYKGETTNSLVIILTNTTKNITSGALNEERAMLAQYIKDNGLSNAVCAQFGKNWTQVPTVDLHTFVETHKNITQNTAKSKEEAYDDILASYGMSKTQEECEEVKDSYSDPKKELAIDSLCHLLRFYFSNGVLCGSDLGEIHAAISDAVIY